MSTGEVVVCSHCEGSGQCHCWICNTVTRIATRIKDDDWTYGGVICSVCKGKGKIWIGPKVIYINSKEAS